MEEELYKSLKDLYEMFDDPEPGSRTWALLRRAKSVLAEYEAAQQDAQADEMMTCPSCKGKKFGLILPIGNYWPCPTCGAKGQVKA